MSDQGFFSHLGLGDGASEHLAVERQIQQALSQLRTNTPVKVVKVEDDKDNPGHHILTVLPLVNQVDGLGNPTKHGEIYGIRAANMSGGNGMAYVVPKAGDIGLMAISDRDMGRAVKNRDQANPDTERWHDLSQGVYLGGFAGLNGQPKQSVVMDDDGIHFKTDKTLFAEAKDIKFKGDLRVEGKIDATKEITAEKDDAPVTLSKHSHDGTPKPTMGT